MCIVILNNLMIFILNAVMVDRFIVLIYDYNDFCFYSFRGYVLILYNFHYYERGPNCIGLIFAEFF